MKRVIIAAAVIVAVLALGIVTSQTIPTSIGITNSPPKLLQNFSDIFIVLNGSLPHYLDLDDYFTDDNGDNITFSHSSINNITILIYANNSVSFIPDPGFIGSQTLVFNASDNKSVTQSNNFTITVGQDVDAPQWSNPTKNRENVYQNYNINFTASWTDNLDLSYFIFSIDQGTGWTNHSLVNFSGVSNVSLESVQISAAGGKTVYWRFYAVDGSGNINVTDIQNFTVLEISSGGSSGSTSTVTGRASGLSQDASSGTSPVFFEVEPKNIRVSLRQGDTLTRVVKIKSLVDQDLAFSLFLEGISDFALLGADSFTLKSSESYDLLLDFKIPSDTVPDQYFGQLVIQSSQTVTIPIVIDVRKFNAEIEIEVNVTDESRFVNTGEQVSARIAVRNLQDVRETPGELFYAIKDFQGNILESANEEITLYASFDELRSLTVPAGNYDGEFIFYARIIANDLVDLDSDTFFIGSRFRILYWADKLLYPILILILLALIFLLIWVRERSRRKKKLLELYLLLNELKSLVEKGKMDSALKIYKKVKVTYGQHLPKGMLQDKEKLREELEKFSKLLRKVKKKDVPPKESGDAKSESSKKGEGVDSGESADSSASEAESSKNEEAPKEDEEKNDGNESSEPPKEGASKESSEESKEEKTGKSEVPEEKLKDEGKQDQQKKVAKEDSVPSKAKTSKASKEQEVVPIKEGEPAKKAPKKDLSSKDAVMRKQVGDALAGVAKGKVKKPSSSDKEVKKDGDAKSEA